MPSPKRDKYKASGGKLLDENDSVFDLTAWIKSIGVTILTAFKLKNKAGDEIDPATEDKQDTIITELDDLSIAKTNGFISAGNSSITPLGADGVFTGETEEIKDYAAINVVIKTDQDSVNHGLHLEWSSDGINWDEVTQLKVTANKTRSSEFGIRARYFRIVYINGSVAQTFFRLHTTYHPVRTRIFSKELETDLDIHDFAPTRRAVIAAQTPSDGPFTNIQATTAGNLKISLEEWNGGFKTAPLPVADLLLEIAKGEIVGHSKIQKFGANASVGTSFVDIWDGLVNYVFSATAVAHYISSSNNGDTQEYEVQGLDADYNLQTVNVTAVGQTKTRIGTTETFIRVFRVKNIGATDNAGAVYIYEDDTPTAGVPATASKIKAKVLAGNNQTLMSIYTVPAGKTAYLLRSYASAGASKIATIKMLAKPFGGVFQIKNRITLTNDNIVNDFKAIPVFTEKTDIKVSALVDVGTADISAGFDLVLIDND